MTVSNLEPTRAVTSYDVAKRAGVSQSAVSRAFTPGGSVSPETRERIMAAVADLGYRPNAIARSLITQRSNMVAILVANIDFHPELTATLARAFARRGLHALLFTLEHENEADRVVDEIWQYRVDGVVAAITLPPRHIALLGERRIPLVFINRQHPELGVSAVCCDHADGVRRLIDGLLAGGHRRFGIITGPPGSAVSSERVKAARTRLAEAGIGSVASAQGRFDYPSGRSALHELAAAEDGLPEAVIAVNDMMALGALDAARHDLGLDVPGAVSVVGFDGLAAAGWASYNLATIRQPTAVMVEAAANLLLTRLEEPGAPAETRMFAGELVRGGSARLG